ncbi:Aspartate--tRNA ligase 2, cytoplasmic [Linum grandiflorum]
MCSIAEDETVRTMAALDSVCTAQEGEELDFATHKLFGEVCVMDEELDWISQLPNEVLINIVCRLNLADAIRTSVLSRSWRNLWKSAVSVLDFDASQELLAIRQLHPDVAVRTLREKRRWYMDWVNGVVTQMQQSCSRLTKFRVSFNLPGKCNSEGDIDRWLNFAISKRVESLHLSFDYEMRDFLNYVFSEECYNHIKTPAGMDDIRNLRSLRLSYVDVQCEILEHFIANCPVLEELVVNWSLRITKLKVVGSSHSPLRLKHLEVRYYLFLESLEIDHAPHLERLIYVGSGCLEEVRIGNCPSLVDMTLDNGFICNQTFRSLPGCASRLVSLFVKVNGLRESFSDFAEHSNLERLTLQVLNGTYSSMLGLISLVNVCPRLHTLQLFLHTSRISRRLRRRVDVVKVRRDSIKVVEVAGFRGYVVEYEFVEYVMEYFVGLERIVIDWSTALVFDGLECSTMSSSSEPQNPPPEQEAVSKKAAKKEAAKQEKLRKKAEAAALSKAASSLSVDDAEDPLAGNYGDVPLKDQQSAHEADVSSWTAVGELNADLKDKDILIRGRVHAVRPVGKNMAFVVVRQSGCTVQCVVTAQPDVVSRQMVKFVSGLSTESVIDVHGKVSVPSVEIKGATQQVEVQVKKLYCLSRAMPTLPISIHDASRSEKEIEEALEAGEKLVRVNQDTRLNYRVLDLRTATSQAIFKIESRVKLAFMNFMDSEGFDDVTTPKLIAGSSEGGAAVFRLDYKGEPACLAQSPQLHKQMAVAGDFGRVFVVGPVFRAEDSNTHRHLCEFTGLDVEMEIKSHYSEVMDIVDRLFVTIFDTLNNEKYKPLLEAIDKQYPFEPLKYLRQTLRLKFEDGIQMLKDAGVEVDPLGDLNTETERRLGELVLKKYNTEFYILYGYPSNIRPFYTMPCHDDPRYSNSFDVFIRGEEIISGAQRIHVPDLLEQRAKECGIDVSTISTYIDSFRYGMHPHGGFGVGLERVVMLFCGLNNIRKTSMFPRDPRRLTP